MPVSYSVDLRRRVIAAWEAHDGSQRHLAQRFKVSLSFVRNLLRHYRQNGEIEAKKRGGHQKPTIQNRTS
ncbi:helix-turn-helix domain-containing protein [Nostoc sp. FACHB-888]|jgi:transposase|uniref:helix-turn-helix domain-containing protein n=1 Tax=Nostoc sp. FACHB-888 TaxID=2692842 RepID=UPI001F54C835|nr:helix-turn-helix domain-containing protein [Nostoc sp. FACHB-888]